MRILKSIDGKFTKTDLDDFDRAISVMKLQEGDINKPTTDKKIEKFFKQIELVLNSYIKKKIS